MAIIITILVLYMGGMLAIGFMGKKSSSSMNLLQNSFSFSGAKPVYIYIGILYNKLIVFDIL